MPHVPRRQPKNRYILSLVLLTLLIYTSVFSPLFAIKEVIITGNENISSERIEEAVRIQQQQRLWYVFPQRHLLFFSQNELSLLLADIRLKGLNIERRFPKTMVIHVEEKRIVGEWQYHDQRFAIDETGTIISELTGPIENLSNQYNTKIRLMNSEALSDPRVGDTLIDQTTLKLIERVIRARPTGVRAFTLFDVARASQGQITAYTDEHWKVYIGTSTDLDGQMAKLATFMAEKDRTGTRWREITDYVDLRFGNTRVYYK